MGRTSIGLDALQGRRVPSALLLRLHREDAQGAGGSLVRDRPVSSRARENAKTTIVEMVSDIGAGACDIAYATGLEREYLHDLLDEMVTAGELETRPSPKKKQATHYVAARTKKS